MLPHLLRLRLLLKLSPRHLLKLFLRLLKLRLRLKHLSLRLLKRKYLRLLLTIHLYLLMSLINLKRLLLKRKQPNSQRKNRLKLSRLIKHVNLLRDLLSRLHRLRDLHWLLLRDHLRQLLRDLVLRNPHSSQRVARNLYHPLPVLFPLTEFWLRTRTIHLDIHRVPQHRRVIFSL